MWLLPSRYAAGLAALWVVVCSASPTPVEVMVAKPEDDLVFREALELARQPHLEKRLSADFHMDKTWKNEVLFAGSWVDSGGSGDVESVSLAVTCVDCYTKGTVVAKLTDEDIIDPTVRLEFHGVEAYVDMEVAMSTGAAYAVNLFASNSPIGLGFPGLSVGVVFYVDLVFSLTDQIDLEGGFYVKLADDAYLEASVFGGDITDHFFDGLSSKSLPVTVRSGRATFKADLRLRVQCGAEAGFMGIGAGAELGIYANIIEFVAVLDSTPTCELQTTEWWDLNVGAYAHLDVVVDYTTIGAIPTISTTLLTAPTLTQCWISGSPAETEGYLTQTDSTSSIPAGSVVVSASVSSPFEGRPTGSLTTPTVPTVTAAASVSLSGYPSSSGRYPAANSSTSAGGDSLVTSTIFTTTVYTITSCAASVVNCPASYEKEIIVTQTVDVYTTVCPASANITLPATRPNTSAAQATAAAVVEVITDVVVLIPCPTPVIETFTPPNTIIPPSMHHITATAGVAAPSASSAAASPSFTGGIGVKVAQWNNSTSSYLPSPSTNLNTYTYSTSTDAPSASRVRTTAAPVMPTAVPTAGAAGRAVTGGLVLAAGAVAAWMVL